MKPLFTFLVEPIDGKRYTPIANNGLVLSASQEDHQVTNRQAIVVDTPYTYKGEITKGDILLVHHNTFRKYYDVKGRERNGTSYFKDGLYFIFNEQFYLYKHNGKWTSVNSFCFVEPTEDALIGKLVYGNKETEELGIKEGDTVVFQPDSEYEFNVEGKKLYRMYTRNLCLIIA